MTSPSPTDDHQGRISGISILAQLRLIEAYLGPLRYASFLGQLSPDDRRALDELTALSWAPIALSTRVFEAAAATAERDVGEFQDEIIGASVEINYKTVWRVLLGLGSDEALVSRAGAMIHRVYDRGDVSAKIVSPGHAEVRITRWAGMPDRVLRGLRVATYKILALSRRRQVSVEVARTADGARFDVRWRT